MSEEVEIGEKIDSDKKVAEFLKERADEIMETWQMATALERMSNMMSGDERKIFGKLAKVLVREFLKSLLIEEVTAWKREKAEEEEEMKISEKTKRRSKRRKKEEGDKGGVEQEQQA